MDKTRALVDWAISVSVRLLAIEHVLKQNGALLQEPLDLATQAVEEKLKAEMAARKSSGSTELQTKIAALTALTALTAPRRPD